MVCNPAVNCLFGIFAGGGPSGRPGSAMNRYREDRKTLMPDLITCDNCGNDLDTEDVILPVDSSDPHCRSCVIRCYYCGDYYCDIDDHGYGRCIDCGRIICPSSYYSLCESCDEYVHHGCECPYHSHAGLRPYGDNPELMFHGSARFYMGVELEYDYAAAEVVEAVQGYDDCEEYLWLCEDGSISAGAEVISHPMSLEFHQ